MAKNPQRRQAKALRRKKQLAERRRTEAANPREGLAQQVRRAAAGAIRSCLIQEGLFERGNGMVILTRQPGPGRLAMAAFLVDTFCLGVKQALFRQDGETEVEMMIDAVGADAPFEETDPAFARKLLHEAVNYARSLGIEPDTDYAAAELLFGDVAAQSCEAQFTFGQDGRPNFIPGPTDSPTRIRKTLERLRRKLGSDGFEFSRIEEDFDESDWFDDSDESEDDEADDEFDEVDGYDPAVAPSPAEWLAMPEAHRMAMIRSFHREAGVSLPNEEIHAGMHAAVENQIAMGDELPVRRAIERLMGEGLDRHEAVHAVAAVLSAHIVDMLKTDQSPEAGQKTYEAEIEALTAEKWRREFGSEEDE